LQLPSKRLKAVPDEEGEIRCCEIVNWLSGNRMQRFSISNTKAYHWTWSWTSSICLSPSPHISLRSIMMFSHLLLGLTNGRFQSYFST
jgi:hypothetical protein